MRDRLTGVLNLIKPVGMTSHDVVARVRYLSKQREVGHAGTLDPLASGVLVVLMGRATGLASFATASTKVYAADVVLGVGTNTDDAEGEISVELPLPAMNTDELSSALDPLRGEISQVPPQFSAVKRGGRTAYVEARKGRRIELEPRPVTVESLVVLSWQSPRLRLLIKTGPGTYIRSIARDAGLLLGTAAYLHALVRAASGPFSITHGVEVNDGIDIADILYPSDVLLSHLPAVFLSSRQTETARHGGLIGVIGDQPNEEVMRIYGSSGTLVALGRVRDQYIHPFKVLEPAA